MERREQCLVCGHKALVHHLDSQDYFGTQDAFQILRCPKCNTSYTSPFPSPQESITYYKSSSYVSHGDSKGLIFDQIYSFIKKFNQRDKYRVLQQYIQGKRHLDIGCGTGDFLHYLKQKRFQTLGVEVDNEARSITASKGINVHARLEDLPSSRHSSISMIHVLEHVHQYNEYIHYIHEHLEDGGILFLALPNYNSADAKHFHKYWAGLDVPRHLYHFTQQSIKTLGEQVGLKLVAVHPMKYDSYYASLLSHQYQYGKTNYLQAAISGYKSNRKARKTGEYSSLIYILQK